MKARFIALILLLCSTSMTSQSTMELIFSAIDSTTHVQFDSVKVKNLTQGGDTTLIWPDSVLTFYISNLEETFIRESSFQVFQNYPNPVVNQTNVNLYLPDKGKLSMILTDILGRRLLYEVITLEKGHHNFSLTPGKQEVYFLSVGFENKFKTIKVLNQSKASNSRLEMHYVGKSDLNSTYKNYKKTEAFLFSIGDQLLYTAFKDSLESGTYDTPILASTVYTFQFANNIPCKGIPSFEYEGQIYSTIQIANQCWMKDNLNVGVMLNAPQMPANNGVVEKYCLSNYNINCDLVGGLYHWYEMMNYVNVNGSRGICPDGWHIPTDLDWQILEGTVDSEVGIGDSHWSALDWRGTNAGGMLKQTGTEYWQPPNEGASDSYGFSALPGGYFVQGDFWGAGWKGYYWSSDPNNKYFRNIDWNQIKIKRDEGGSNLAISVRCIKNDYSPSHVTPIYLLGNGTTVGWDNTQALPMAWIGEGNFARVETLTPGNDHSLKFISDLGAWAPQWGTDATGTSEEGPLVYRPTEDIPDPDAIPIGDIDGDYYIEADTADIEYFIDLTTGDLFILGSATTAGWDTGEAIQMNEDSPHIFTIELPLYADGELKFIEQLASWEKGWGTNDYGSSSEGTIGRWPSLSSETGEYNKDIPGPETEGLYLITVDMRIMKYTIEGR